MRIWTGLFVPLVLGAGGLAAGRWWQAQTARYRNVERIVRGPADRDAQIVDEICDVSIEYVYVQRRESADRQLVFSYYPMAASPMLQREDVPPTVTWLDAGHLRIAIDVVSQVLERHERVEGIAVQYRIGREIYAPTS